MSKSLKSLSIYDAAMSSVATALDQMQGMTICKLYDVKCICQTDNSTVSLHLLCAEMHLTLISIPVDNTAFSLFSAPLC